MLADAGGERHRHSGDPCDAVHLQFRLGGDPGDQGPEPAPIVRLPVENL